MQGMKDGVTQVFTTVRVIFDRETELLWASHLKRQPHWAPIQERDVRWCHSLLMLKHILDLSENNMALKCLSCYFSC